MAIEAIADIGRMVGEVPGDLFQLDRGSELSYDITFRLL